MANSGCLKANLPGRDSGLEDQQTVGNMDDIGQGSLEMPNKFI